MEKKNVAAGAALACVLSCSTPFMATASADSLKVPNASVQGLMRKGDSSSRPEIILAAGTFRQNGSGMQKGPFEMMGVFPLSSAGKFGLDGSVGYFSGDSTRDGLIFGATPYYMVDDSIKLFATGAAFAYANTVNIPGSQFYSDKHGVVPFAAVGGELYLTREIGIVMQASKVFAGSQSSTQLFTGVAIRPSMERESDSGLSAGSGSIVLTAGLSVLNDAVDQHSPMEQIAYQKQLNSWFGLQAGYLNEGTKRVFGEEYTRRGVFLGPVFTYNFKNVKTFIDASLYRYSATGAVNATGVTPMVGIGLSFPVLKEASVVVEWNRVLMRNQSMANIDADQYEVGVKLPLP